MVTRETLAAGLAALGLDPAVAERLARYHDLLLNEAIPRGFVGPAEQERLAERHLLESAALAPLVPIGGCVVDVGSGAGLPGIVVACLVRTSVTLLESEGRRAAFLEDVVHDLALDAQVVRRRAEDAARTELRESFDCALARALASPPVALELTLPFVRPGGTVVLAAGPSASSGSGAAGGEDPLEALSRAALQLGGGTPELRRLRVPGLDAERWAIIVPKAGVCPDRYPRRAGVPARRPLGTL